MARGGSLKSYSSYTHGSYSAPKPILNYILVILVIIALIVSALALVNVYQLRKSITPATISVKDFLAKLTAHPEMKNYVGIAPLNIIQVNNNNLANLQAQISGLDTAYIGSFIVQYTDAIVVYDYNNDLIKGNVNLQQPQQAALPGDFFTKLNAHPELQGLENEQPIGGQFDENSLNTLKQQFPDVYANAKVGDFLLRYTTKLIIYDYNDDAIVNALALG